MTPVRATAWIGLSSAATLAVSVLAMKAYAMLVGPSGVGLLSLMQSLINLGVIVAGVGVSTSAISALSAAIASHNAGGTEAVRRSAISLAIATGAVGAGLLVVLREPVAEIALGSAQRANDVVVLAAALLCSVAAFGRISVLTGRRAIAPLAVVSVATGVGAVATGIALVLAFGIAGLAPAVLAAALVHLGLASWFERKVRSPVPANPSSEEIASAALQLVKRGLPIAASQLAGSGAALVTPVIVLHLLGTHEVGYYRAATALSVGYLTVFVAALTQDYLPRISAAHSSKDLALMVERQMRLVLGLSLPIILGLLAAGPMIMEVLYAQEFSPAFAILKWQLVGDLFRLPAWILAFVLLARARSGAYFSAELVAGASLVLGTVIGVLGLGLAGAGVAYAASQVIYYSVVWMLVLRYVPTTPGRLQAVAMVSAVASVGILLANPGEPMRTLLFAAGACLLAAFALPRVYRMIRDSELEASP